MSSYTSDRTDTPGLGAENYWFDRLLNATLLISSVFLLLQASIMIADIVYGTISAEAGFYRSNRYAQTLLIWITFLTVALHARDDDHIRVKYFYKKFPKLARRIFDLSETALNLLFAGLIAYGTYDIGTDVYLHTTAEGVPTILIYLPLLICSLLLLGVFGRQLFVMADLKNLLSRGGDGDD